jgi:antitoxin component YwqK of YwqJK toxin-antitoxin module
VLLSNGVTVFAKKEKLPDTNVPLNRFDADGKRNGTWWITHKAGMGEEASSEFGNYDGGVKYGKWYKLDKEGDITAIEMFKNDRLDGEVKYYEKGILYCTGFYRTFKTGADRDTIMVVNPENDEQMLREVLAEHNTMRHGIWRFFDETTGKLIKEEEYQVDSLIWSKRYTSPQDSLANAKRESLMPHNKKKYKKEQTNPKGQVLN